MSDENQTNPDDSNKSTFDKVVMGAIIGTAIGSVVGASIAPKKGEETREILKEKAQEAAKMTGETTRGVFRLIRAILKRLLFGPEKKKQTLPEPSEMKEIPTEHV